MAESNADTTAQSGSRAMPMSMRAPPANIPPPRPLLMDNNLSTNWKQWRKFWQRFEVATGIFKQEDLIRVATLLSVVGADTAKVYDTFT